MSEQPRAVEPVPVQLTRMEGTINLIAYQMAEVKADVADVKADLAGVKDRVAAVEKAQASADGASSSWRTWLPILTGFAATGAALVALFAK